MPPPRTSLWRDRALRFLTGAGSTIAAAVMGVIRNKWLALHLDTTGIGVLAQTASGQNWLGALAGLGLSLPVARAVGAAGGAEDAALARRAVWTAFSLAGLAAVLVGGAGFLFAEPLSVLLLGSPEHALLVRISMLGVVGLALQGVLTGLFAGRSDLRANLTLTLGGGLVAVAVTCVLVPRYGLAGGALGLAVLAPAGVAVALLTTGRSTEAALRPVPSKPLDPSLARAMIRVGAAALLLALVDLGALLAVRAHYLRVNGVAANGLLQAALALAQQVGALFYAYLSNYAFGRVSAAAAAAGAPAAAGGAGPTGPAGAGAVREYTRRHWAPLVLLAAATVAAVMVAAAPLLHLLYSSRFDAARPLMAWALVGEFCRVSMNIWAVGALPIGGLRLWLPIGLLPSTGLVLSYLAIQGLGTGPLSVPLAYVGAGLFSLVGGGIAMSRAGVTLTHRDVGAVLACAAGLAALAAWLTR